MLQETADRLTEQLAGKARVVILTNGIQVHFNGIILTFYYKSYKYHHNITGKYKAFKKNEECAEVAKYLSAASQKKAKPIITKEHRDRGAQACIDHIKRKLELFSHQNPNQHNKTHLMLNILIDELHQYL